MSRVILTVPVEYDGILVEIITVKEIDPDSRYTVESVRADGAESSLRTLTVATAEYAMSKALARAGWGLIVFQDETHAYGG